MISIEGADPGGVAIQNRIVSWEAFDELADTPVIAGAEGMVVTRPRLRHNPKELLFRKSRARRTPPSPHDPERMVASAARTLATLDARVTSRHARMVVRRAIQAVQRGRERARRLNDVAKDADASLFGRTRAKLLLGSTNLTKRMIARAWHPIVRASPTLRRASEATRMFRQGVAIAQTSTEKQIEASTPVRIRVLPRAITPQATPNQAPCPSSAESVKNKNESICC